MPCWKFCCGLIILAVMVACGRPQVEPWSHRVKQAGVARLLEVPEVARGDYQEGFSNGATMIHEALNAGVRPFRPVIDMPAPKPRCKGPVPEGVAFETIPLAPEVDPATGLLLRSAGAKNPFYAKGQVEGFDWALATCGQSLVRPIPVLAMPSRWTSWKAHQGGEDLDHGSWTARVLWVPGQLSWARKERGFPSQRIWRPWEDPEAPRWVAMGDGVLWLETGGGQAIAVDLESGGILDLRLAVPHEASREESWESSNQEVLKEFHSPEFQQGLEALRNTAASGQVADLLAVVEYLQGMGTEADREAFGWSLKAAEKDSPKAMLQVGVSLFHGEGGPMDKVAARMWLERAVKAGDPDAPAVLKLLFTDGSVPAHP